MPSSHQDPPQPQDCKIIGEMLARPGSGDNPSPFAQPTLLHLVALALFLASHLGVQQTEAVRRQAMTLSAALGESASDTRLLLDIAEQHVHDVDVQLASQPVDIMQAQIWFDALLAYLDRFEQWARQA